MRGTWWVWRRESSPGASTMGIGALFEDALGQVEAMLGLGALLWLVGLSALVVRARTG